MFGVDTASKKDYLTGQRQCETSPSQSNAVGFVHVRSQIGCERSFQSQNLHNSSLKWPNTHSMDY